MISGCIAVPDKDPKTWRSRARKKRPVIACAAIVTPPPLKKRLRHPPTQLQRSIIVEPKQPMNTFLAHLLEEISPEEHRRRGELADELFRTIARRAKQPVMAELDIVIPGPEIDSDPDAVALWDQTGKFIGAALAQMDRGTAFSIMLGRLQHELRDAYGAENARKVMHAILETME
jgi:hypothetical protein